MRAGPESAHMRAVSDPTSPRLRSRILLIGAATILLLTGGAATAVHGYNDETGRICGEAKTAARATASVKADSVAKAVKARALADSVKGYRTDKAESLLAGVDKAIPGQAMPAPECTTRDEAAALVSIASATADKAEALSHAADELSADVATFQAAETKRIAAEKKARDEKAAATAAAARKKAEAKAAAIAEQAKAAAAEDQSMPAPAYAVPAPAQVPAAEYQAPPVQPVPAPAPVSVAPVPAPAPGGWTPPPAGAGQGSGGCTQIGDHVMCVGPR